MFLNGRGENSHPQQLSSRAGTKFPRSWENFQKLVTLDMVHLSNYIIGNSTVTTKEGSCIGTIVEHTVGSLGSDG